MFGVGDVIESCIVTRPCHEAFGRPHSFGEARVTVRIAPINTAFRFTFDQDRVSVTGDGAVGRSHADTVDSGRIESNVADHVDGFGRRWNLGKEVAIQ